MVIIEHPGGDNWYMSIIGSLRYVLAVRTASQCGQNMSDGGGALVLGDITLEDRVFNDKSFDEGCS